MKPLAVLIFLGFWLAACSLPTGIPPTTPPILPSSTPSPAPEIQKVVSVALSVRGSAQTSPEIAAGSSIVVEAVFNPVIQVLNRRADGSVLSSSASTWEDAPQMQMRTCVSVDPLPCELGEWQPFQPQVSREFPVDWLGWRQFHLTVEFADAAGQPIPSVRSYDFDSQFQTNLSMNVFASLDPTTPLAQFPAPVQTAAAATQTAYPVSGSVQIEGGRCCAGGTAGTTIQLQVDFQAASRTGEVTEMKVQVGPCVRKPSDLESSWEPFQPQRTYETTLAINWVGWSISVQYRDSGGNLSPVYCDDISLEGSPPNPTP